MPWSAGRPAAETGLSLGRLGIAVIIECVQLVRRRLDGSNEVTAQTILGLYALAPAYDHRFDARARYSIPPITATPSTQEGDHIRPYVILAKNLKQLVRRRFPFMNEGVDALLPCCHPFF